MAICPNCKRYTDCGETCTICRELVCKCCESEFYDSPPPESNIVCDCDTGYCEKCNETPKSKNYRSGTTLFDCGGK